MSGLERINRCGRLIEGIRRGFLKYYLKKCPTLFHICYDPIGTHRKARAFIGFLFGFLAAVVLYETIIVDLQFDAYISISLGAILVLMLSIGCASSIQVISFSYFTRFYIPRRDTLSYHFTLILSRRSTRSSNINDSFMRIFSIQKFSCPSIDHILCVSLSLDSLNFTQSLLISRSFRSYW